MVLGSDNILASRHIQACHGVDVAHMLDSNRMAFPLYSNISV